MLSSFDWSTVKSSIAAQKASFIAFGMRSEASNRNAFAARRASADRFYTSSG